MSKLEDKLRDILKQPHQNSTGAIVMTFITDKTVEQIIQAFREEGWVTPEQVKKTQELVNQMANLANDMAMVPTFQYIALNKTQTEARELKTGPEWYDQLIKEVDHEKVEWPENVSKEYITAVIGNVYLAAARRASGMEEKK